VHAQQEADARRARRALLIFRLTFYPAALAIAIALLAARHGGPEPMETYAGMTGQNHRFIVGVREDKVVFFDTVLLGECSKGGSWSFHWFPTDGPSPRFVQTGGRLQVATSFPAQYGTRWPRPFPRSTTGRRRRWSCRWTAAGRATSSAGR
jgi:hypothetical protein